MVKSAHFYDLMYRSKNYAVESQRLMGLIRQNKRSEGRELLDVGCGTGQHLAYLQADYTVSGLDFDEGLLAIAAQRLAGVPLYQADMITFNLERTFDVITNLFSAIGYVRTLENLNRTVATMARHLKPDGLLLVEPWLYPQFYRTDPDFTDFINEPDLKISVQGTLEAGISVLTYRYWVRTTDGTDRFDERHELGLFTPQQYQTAFESAGLETTNHMLGLDGRGLWIGVKP